MYCPHCGVRAGEDHAWCQSCGAILPRSEYGSVGPSNPSGLIGAIGSPGLRLAAYAVAGLVAVLIVGELLRLVVALVLPTLLLIAVLYWARQRRRRLYQR
jgi:hypothetical protein